MTTPAPEQPLLVCLVPVRNAAADLPGFFASIRLFCDAVIALDDGSTDDSAELLANEPLVKILLRNRARPDYTGWDDAANRNRLLAAAVELNPEWIISIDADERIDEPEARALRLFLETDALPGCAYGFRHVPMRGETEFFQPKYQWIYRLFSFESGQHFPAQRLHFIPVPTTIPRRRWIKTTLRIQHLGGLTDERRLARYEKYLEADPARDFQSRYSPLLDSPSDHRLRRWLPRPEGVPVLLTNASNPDLLSPDDPEAGCALSVIVISRNDEATIATTMEAIVSQIGPEPFEVILVTSGTDRTADIVRAQFPEVKVIVLSKPALPGEARNAGLRAAKGSFVTFPGSHVLLRPGSLAARLESHRRGYAMVTALVENGTRTPAGWASYFLDHSQGMPGQLSAPLNGPPAHCSYAYLALMEVGGFPEGVRTAEDTMVNRELVRRGYVAYRDARVHFVHLSPCNTWKKLLRHHFTRGRGSGRLTILDHQETGHLLTHQFLKSRLLLHVLSRLKHINQGVAQATPELRSQYQQAKPGVVAGIVANWLGMCWEILRPAPGKLSILIGHPQRILLVASTGPNASASLIKIDRVAERVTSRKLPLALHIDTAPGTTTLKSLIANLAASKPSPTDGEHSPLQDLDRFLDIDHLAYLAGNDADLKRCFHSGGKSTSALRLLSNVRQIARTFRYWRNGRIATSLGAWELLQLSRDLRKAELSGNRHGVGETAPEPDR